MERSNFGYNLTNIRSAAPNPKGKRNKGSMKLSRSMLPQVQRLIVPKFRDTGGHWAQNDIEKPYSLDVFEGESDFFIPEAPMTRQDFAIAIVKACNIRIMENLNKKSSASKRKTEEQSLFTDIGVHDPNYGYIKDAVGKGIIQGAPDGTFHPIEP